MIIPIPSLPHRALFVATLIAAAALRPAAQETLTAVASAPIESFEIVPGYPRNGIEWQARQELGVNSIYYGLKYPQPWLTGGLGGAAERGTAIELMHRSSTELPPRGTALGRYLFVAGNNAILRFDRQAADRDTRPPAILITSGEGSTFSAAGIASGTDLMALNGRIYWGESDGTRLQIWSHAPELGGPSVLHAQLTHSGPAPGLFRRLAALSASEGIALTQNGMLLSFRHDDLFTALNGPSTMTLLATGVTGFDSRRETYLQGGLPFEGSALYFTVGHTLQPFSGPSTLQRRRKGILGTWLGASTVWSTAIGASGHYDSLTEVAVDDGYLYLRRAPVGETVFGIVAYPADRTFRATSAAGSPAATLPGTLDVIPADGNQLRADRFRLYYARGAGVYSVAGNVEPIPVTQLDFEAQAVEITQSIQTLDHSVTLVARKRTFVRGYARQRVNVNTGIDAFSPEARLRVFFRPVLPAGAPEVELTNPINPLAPANRPLLLDRSSGELRNLPAHSYLWELPASFVDRPGWMRAEMTLLPGGTAAETRDPANPTLDPALNNTAQSVHGNPLGVSFTAMPEPGLLFVPVETYHKRYTGDSLARENLRPFLDRALTQLPVPGFRTAVALDLEVDDLMGAPLDMDAWGAKEIAMLDLYKLWFFYSDPAGFPDTHWVGCVHEESQGQFTGIKVRFNGLGSDGEQSLITLRRAPYKNSTWPGSGPHGGFNLAHELGHNWDQDHVNCGDPDGPDLEYPYNPCQIGPGVLGALTSRMAFDPLTQATLNEVQAADLMSYGLQVWVSDYTWTRLLDQIVDDDGFSLRAGKTPPQKPARIASGSSGPYFTLSGLFDESAGTAMLAPSFCQPAADFSAEALARSVEEASGVTAPVLVCRQRAADGSLLAETPVVLRRVHDPAEEGGPGAVIAQLVPAAPDVERIELVTVDDGLAIAGVVASDHAPDVELTAVQMDAAEKRVRLEWSAQDADGDPLVFTLVWRTVSTSGEMTRVLRSQVRGLSADLPLAALPAGSGRFAVMVSDGFRSDEAESGEVEIPEHPPELSVSGLVAGQTVDLWAPNGPGLTVCASALDVDDGPGLTAAGTVWTWSGPESGTAEGCGISTGRLFPGDYVLTARLTDAAGHPATTSLPFTVAPPAVPESSASTLDGVKDGAEYAGGPSFSWPLSGGGTASCTLSHGGGALHIMFEGLPVGPEGIGAGFLIDVDGSRSAGLEADDLAIEVSADGALSFWTGASGNWLPAPPPAALVEAAIFRGETHWSAEIRVPDAVIGGWDRDAAFRCYAMKEWPYDAFPVASDHGSPATWMPVHWGAAPAAATAPPTPHVTGGGSFAPVAVDTFTLDASASVNSRGNGDGLTFLWSQTEGPAVVLADETAAVASFGHGPVTAPARLVFQVVVSEGGWSGDPATVEMYFHPAPAEVAWPEAGGSEGSVALERAVDGSVRVEFDAAAWFGPGGALAPDGPSLSVAGAMFTVEASADLADWTSLLPTPADAAGRVRVTDPAASGETRRFYRLRRGVSAP